MNSKELVKIIMVKERLTAKVLAEMLTKETDKKYTHQSVLHKISLSSFRYDEIKTIADMFGYEIRLDKVNND